MSFLLFKLSRKHKCWFLSMLCSVFFTSCGKPVNVQSEEAHSNDQYLLPGSVMIEATRLKSIYQQNENYIPEELRSIDGTFKFPKLALAKVPDSVYVTDGNAANQLAYVYMNETAHHDFDFYCLYKGQSSTSQPEANSVDEEKGFTYKFLSCHNHLGEDLGLQVGDEFFVDKDNSISVHVDGADPRVDTKTLTTIDVTWY